MTDKADIQAFILNVTADAESLDARFPKCVVRCTDNSSRLIHEDQGPRQHHLFPADRWPPAVSGVFFISSDSAVLAKSQKCSRLVRRIPAQRDTLHE